MTVPSVRTDTTSSTVTEDDLSMMVHDSSETTVATHTSTSLHSVVSDVSVHNHLFIRSPAINVWSKRCSIEPDIRLTTAQEWKLRTCLRRFLTFCNHPLRLRYESPSASQILCDPRPYLGLYLQIPSLTNGSHQLLEVTLLEFSSTATGEQTTVPVTLMKAPRFVFSVLSNVLKLSFRSAHALLELNFSTKDNESIQGTYYKWNTVDNTHQRRNLTLEIDQNLMQQFNINNA